MSIQLDREWKAILVVAALGVLVIAPCYLFGSPSNMDLQNHFRFALPFYNGLQSGHWYPGWNAPVSGGYGDASFRFYPPGLYYLLAGGRALTGSWFGAAQIAYTILSVLGGLGVYLWAREFLPRGWAVVAAGLYVFSPYRVNQLYQAYLFAEFAGGTVLPFCFWFIARVCKRGDWRSIAGLGASFAVLVLTHLPLTVIGGISLAFYGLVSLDRKRLFASLTRLALGAGLGLAASAVFWFPMVREMRWVGLNDLNPDPSVVWYRNFLFSTLSPDNLNVWWVTILALLSFGFFAPTIAAIWRTKPVGEDTRGVSATLLLALFTLAMTTYLTWPLWRLSTTLQGVQFPWRFMTIFSMAGSVGAAGFIPYWLARAKGKQRPISLLVAGAMLIALAFTLGQIIRGAAFLRRPAFDEKLVGLKESPGLAYWWPIWTKPTVFDDHEQIRITARSASVTEWAGEHRKIQVNAGPAGELRVGTLYYPTWQATMNGQSLPTAPGPDGAIMIRLPATAGTVNLDFVEPGHTQLARAFTLLGWIGIFVTAVIGWVAIRRRASTRLTQDE